MASYHHYLIEHPEIENWELRLIKRLAPKAKSLLDLGCGTGSFLEKATWRYQAVGVEINKEAVEVCRQKGLRVRRGDAQKTSFKSGSLDIVRARDLLEHLEKPDRLIAEAKRLLGKDGLLIIHVPTQYSLFYPLTNFWDDYTHVRPFSKKGLKRLLGEFGFQIRYLTGYTAGRNRFEQGLGWLLGKIFPFEWLVMAQKKKRKDDV